MKKLCIFILVFMFINALSYGQTEDSLIFRRGDILYGDTNTLNMVVYIPSESKVKVIEQGEKYFKVIYKEYTGWALKTRLVTEADYFKIVEELNAKKRAKELVDKQERNKAEQARLKAKQEREKAQLDVLYKRRVDLTKKYGSQEIAEKIMAKKIWLGMTSAMALESWGRPEDINRSVGSWGVNEQWIYVNTYLYFENGILTSYQN